MIKKLKVQIYLIVIFAFNLCYYLVFFWTLRWLLMRLAGFKVPYKSSVQRVRFIGLGKLALGKNTVINSGCYLDTRRGITIGENVVIAHDSKIYTLGHDYNDATFVTKGKPVVIEDYAIVFSNVLIMPGVTVGRGAVILPGAVVTKSIPEMAIMGGNPAKQIMERQSLHTDKELYNYWFAI